MRVFWRERGKEKMGLDLGLWRLYTLGLGGLKWDPAQLT